MPAPRHEIESKLIAKAWKSEQYREMLLQDPKAVIAQETGAPLATELKVKALEEDSRTLFLVLPKAPGNAADLSEKELKRAAGGESRNPYVKEQDPV